MDAFNDRGSALCEAGGDDFDESEPFANLLEEVEALADEFAEVDQEGGPGQSSEIVTYLAKNANDISWRVSTPRTDPPIFEGPPEQIKLLMEDIRKKYAPAPDPRWKGPVVRGPVQ
jgi:hypothetical protein